MAKRKQPKRAPSPPRVDYRNTRRGADELRLMIEDSERKDEQRQQNNNRSNELADQQQDDFLST